MIERILMALAVLALGVIVYQLLRARQLGRVRASAHADPLLRPLAPGVPVIVHFTTPGCAPCRL